MRWSSPSIDLKFMRRPELSFASVSLIPSPTQISFTQFSKDSRCNKRHHVVYKSVSRSEITVAIDKYHLNLAGEYRVCAELLKRELFATVTYGNKKGADIYAVGDNRIAAVVEVKASNSNRFVTGFYQKYKTLELPPPDFWVLYSLRSDAGSFVERFFVLSHDEIAQAQALRNCPNEELSYLEIAERCAKGVDNVLVRNIEQHEDRWDKILSHCSTGG